VKGRKVRIQLVDNSAIEGDASVEVSGNKLDDGANRNDSNRKGNLSIIEVEIYEAVRNKE
jgi:hypothetical protein